MGHPDPGSGAGRQGAWGRNEDRQGRGGEAAAVRLPCVPEGVVHKTSPIHATGDAAQDATAIVIPWLHGVDHVQEGQLGRGLRQTIAPGSPGARLNELGLAQALHDPRQESLRDRHLGRDAWDAHPLADGRGREGDHGAHGVVPASGEVESHRASIDLSSRARRRYRLIGMTIVGMPACPWAGTLAVTTAGPWSGGEGYLMTIDALAGKGRRTARGQEVDGLPIGELDASIFNCPACARPLGAGASRCAGCGTRLIARVQAPRAIGFIASGLVVGLLVGGGVMAGISALSRPVVADVATPVASAAPVASVAPVASGGPVIDAGVASSALSALRQSALLNQRLVVDAGRLTTALGASAPSSAELSRILRSLAASATFGDRIAPDLGDWSEASALSTGLTEFYAAIGLTAREGLANALSNTDAYVVAAQQMLTVLDGLTGLDADARALAAQVDLDMPPATIPAAPAAATP